MSKGTYSFVPYVRTGLSQLVDDPDPAFDPNDPAAEPAPVAGGPPRPRTNVDLRLNARKLDGTTTALDVTRVIELYSAAEAKGISDDAVVRREPERFTANFEPNYLAAIEFYDEGLPWAYTPSRPDDAGRRLRPWITLIALKDDGQEWTPGGDGSDGTLPSIFIPSARHAELLPDPKTLWAWAHVHANRSLGATDTEIVSNDPLAVASGLATLLSSDPDLAYSRLVCPRRLAAKTAYTAFVIPSSEIGRIGALKLDHSLIPRATTSAWKAYAGRQDPDHFPVLQRWSFRTGALGDFEELVHLLKPKAVDHRVGVRAIDVQHPGANVPGISDPALGGALKLGGALRVPRTSLTGDELQATQRDEAWFEPYPHAFQRQLASIINLGDQYASSTATAANAGTGVAAVERDPDPVVTPPLYGRWHAMTARLLTDRAGNADPNRRNWVHELNLDPRFRTPAGFGTKVVQADREDLLAGAWAQVGDVLAANQRIRRLQLAQQTAFVWHTADLVPMSETDPARALSLTAPIHSRVLASPQTVRTRLHASRVHPSLLSGPVRRAMRPRGPLAQITRGSSLHGETGIIARVNRGEITTVRPKTTPEGLSTLAGLNAKLLPGGVPNWLVAIFRHVPWLPLLVLLLAVLLAVLAAVLGLVSLVVMILVGGLLLAAALWRIGDVIRRADSLLEGNQTGAAVHELPISPDFRISAPGAAGSQVTLGSGGTDSPQAERFKQALTDVATLRVATLAADTVGENGPKKVEIELDQVAQSTITAIDPAVTMPRRAAALISIPARLRVERPEPLAEAWAYPVFDIPMYRPLVERSAELLLPNINRIEHNSLTLLETNQKFIEAYLVGLNDEFARELLWHEYPTDQRGSYFRQFWDISSLLTDPNADPAGLREQLRDIPPLHTWERASALGEHDNREARGSAAEVVLVVRGELLRRYPNAVIYAQAAVWDTTNGQMDPSKPRRLVTLAASEEDTPPRAKVRTPLYEAKVDPDIYFFGFDLTIEQARGGSGDKPSDPPGWFFVIKERPGEPRFGFQDVSENPIVLWEDVGWDKVTMSGEFLTPTDPNITIPDQTPPALMADKDEQRKDDKNVVWGANVGSAELAYILFQPPAMVAVHASEMLPT